MILQPIGLTGMVDKSLGQHWLRDRTVLDKIAELADEGENCLEIGPGLGTLTSSLLRRFKKVVAVEFDADLARKLPGSFPGKNLEVINEDILKFDFSKMPDKYAVAGNIPYYITSPIIEKVLTAEKLPSKVVLLIQKEVAERVADEKETVLSLFVKNRADVELGPVVKAALFTPPPKVDSQVLVLTPHEPLVSEKVFSIIKLGFSSPRKKLIHNLTPLKSKNELIELFKKLDLSLDARPADLHLDDYERLLNNML